MAEIDGKRDWINDLVWLFFLVVFTGLGAAFGHTTANKQNETGGQDFRLGIENVTVGYYGTMNRCQIGKLHWVSKLPEKQRATYMKHLQCIYAGGDK